MSHCVAIRTVLKDIEAIKAVCVELGLVFRENQKSYQWYGYSVGDYPLPAGFTAKDLGHCEHAIGVPGTPWEIGVVRCRNKDGSLAEGYTLLFDFYGGRGAPIAKALGGTDAKMFVQRYAVVKATLEARRKGHMVTRQTQANGTIRLTIQGRAL
jgi:hypothetical protein